MLTSGEVFAGFTVERLLGQGGMGSVYLARHPRLSRLTALKLLNRDLFLDNEVRARFEREADLAAQLDHPSIVAVYDRGSEDGQLWISMQYVDGVDAAAVNPMTLPPERAVQIIEGVADALDYAHGMGVLHRDVKPANIMLARSSGGQGERVFLADFGIARLREDSTHLTQTGMFTATLAYASPEQMTGAPLGNRSDQYSLACALYWLLAGVGPFDSANPADIIHGHLQMPLPSVRLRRPNLNPALDAVLAAGMAKRPEHRYRSCTEFADAARKALTAVGPPPLPVLPPPTYAPQPYPAPPGYPQPMPPAPMRPMPPQPIPPQPVPRQSPPRPASPPSPQPPPPPMPHHPVLPAAAPPPQVVPAPPNAPQRVAPPGAVPVPQPAAPPAELPPQAAPVSPNVPQPEGSTAVQSPGAVPVSPNVPPSAAPPAELPPQAAPVPPPGMSPPGGPQPMPHPPGVHPAPSAPVSSQPAPTPLSPNASPPSSVQPASPASQPVEPSLMSAQPSSADPAGQVEPESAAAESDSTAGARRGDESPSASDSGAAMLSEIDRDAENAAAEDKGALPPRGQESSAQRAAPDRDGAPPAATGPTGNPAPDSEDGTAAVESSAAASAQFVHGAAPAPGGGTPDGNGGAARRQDPVAAQPLAGPPPGAPPMSGPINSPSGPPPGYPPHSPNPLGPQPVPPRRSLAGLFGALALGSVVVVALAVGLVVVLASRSDSGGDTAAAPATALPKAASPAPAPDPLAASRRAFPTLLPQEPGTIGEGYEDATCYAEKRGDRLNIDEEALTSSPWILAWECRRDVDNPFGMSYTVLEYQSAAAARSVVDTLPTNAATPGRKSGVPFTRHLWIRADPPGPVPSHYYTAKLVVSFPGETTHANYLVYASHRGPARDAQAPLPPAEDELADWWTTAPL
ncbi:protein kinase [Nocardia sp. NPDC050713]|uniref:serine/threonine-protein kinase n=1 Tax=Nocardia sp. NPDC050713 TaxID=3154511 RepID=UPI0033FD8EC4